MTLEPKPNLKGFIHATGLGIIGSAGRKASLSGMGNLLSRAVSAPLAFIFLIASRNLTPYFWAIFALSLGAEFATGHVIGAIVMISFVGLVLRKLPVGMAKTSIQDKPRIDLAGEMPMFLSWREVILSLAGWKAVSRFLGQEIGRLAPSLIGGIVLGGIILAAGLRPGWPVFADIFGHRTVASDVVNALVGAALSPIFFLSPVGNLPVIHALFKTDGLGYSGIISFCLASVLHPRDIKTYARVFGRRQCVMFVALLFAGAVLGGLGSTWIYAAFGFHPSLPPVRLIGKVFRALFGHFG